MAANLDTTRQWRQSGVEGFQRMVQPPARGPARRTQAVMTLFENIDRVSRAGLAKSTGKGRIVVNAQVVAEPDEALLRVFRHALSRFRFKA